MNAAEFITEHCVAEVLQEFRKQLGKILQGRWKKKLFCGWINPWPTGYWRLAKVVREVSLSVVVVFHLPRDSRCQLSEA